MLDLVEELEIDKDGQVDARGMINSLASIGSNDFKTKNAVMTVEIQG